MRQILFGLAGGILGLLFLYTESFVEGDLLFFDFLHKRLLPETESNVAIVEIDPTTVELFGWPISKLVYAGAIDRLLEAGAKGVGVDFFLTDRSLSIKNEENESDSQEQTGTKTLADIVNGTNTVFATYKITSESNDIKTFPSTPKSGYLKCLSTEPHSYIKPLLPELTKQNLYSGHTHLIPNPNDGVHRRIVPCESVYDGCFMDFASVLTGIHPVADNCNKSVIVPSFHPYKEFSRMSLHQLVLPSNDDEEQTVNRVKEFAQSRYVILGLSDPTLGDFGPTVQDAREPLVVLHANRIDSLLNKIHITEIRRLYPAGASMVLLLITILWLTRIRYLVFAACFGFIAAIGICVVLFKSHYYWIPPSSFTLSYVLGTMGASGYGAWRYYIYNKMLAQAFDSYVAPEVMDWLRETEGKALHPKAADRREISILFSDIAGFTTLSNSLSAQKVMKALRLYLDSMLAVTKSHGGYIDKIEGDGLMILFGAPKQIGEHAELAVSCAMKMQQEINRLQKAWTAITERPLLVRIGISTGTVFVGNLGSHNHIEYTSIGRDVNLASRLEANSEKGGVLISERTLELITDPPPGHWEDVAAKGYSDPVKAWQIPKSYFGTDEN